MTVITEFETIIVCRQIIDLRFKGGWATEGVGHGYGRGYSLEVMAKWMRKIEA